MAVTDDVNKCRLSFSDNDGKQVVQEEHQRLQQLAATATDRGSGGGGGGRPQSQRHSESVVGQTDMAESGTRTTDGEVKESPVDDGSDVSVSAAVTAAYNSAADPAPGGVSSTSQVQVSSIPVSQLINVSASGTTFNVISAESLQPLQV